MKSARFMLSLSVLLMSLSLAAIAQSEAQKPQSNAEKSFTVLKTLAGAWEGPVVMDAHAHDASDTLKVSLRVTSRGNAVVHEMYDPKTPDDPARNDHPVTMFFVDSDKLILTHYCDAGNRPRMAGKISDDGKKIEFDFLDVSGSDKFGHMYHAVFTIIDANHHTEEWTYMMPGNKPMHARVDLQRVPQQQASAH